MQHMDMAVAQLSDLLSRFRTCTSSGGAGPTSKTCLSTYARLFERFSVASREDEVAQRAVASHFNVLSALGVGNSELLHSNVLGWLFSADPRWPGSHAQGSLGFQIFLKRLGLEQSWADYPYSVSRECVGLESRVDLLIASPKIFAIYIENKIWSEEGEDQSGREWRDLQRIGDRLGVPVDSRVAFYLTPNGTAPADIHFRIITWSSVSAILSQFAESAQPPAVRIFASHLATAIQLTLGSLGICSENKHE
jgi:hypothetical protein